MGSAVFANSSTLIAVVPKSRRGVLGGISAIYYASSSRHRSLRNTGAPELAGFKKEFHLAA